MNDLYELYENLCISISGYQQQINDKAPDEFDEILNDLIKERKEMIDNINASHPEIRALYMRKKQIQKTFTHEQIDYICCQIGDWYLMMKPLLEGSHNLGYMKEKLKTMICGE